MKRLTQNNYKKTMNLILELFPDEFITDEAMNDIIELCVAMANYRKITIEEFIYNMKKENKLWKITFRTTNNLQYIMK